MNSTSRRVLQLSILILIACLTALWIRGPSVRFGMPYFYNEDEGHHFNRTVEMVQKGDFNPHYFHKPSFHFYLRMPVVAASYLWAVRSGRLRSIQDIETRDEFGLAGYAFTASHPSIVKWNRSLSLLLSLGVVLLACLIAAELFQSKVVVLCAGLLTALSPALVGQSAVIGVDMPVSFLVLAAVWLALRYYDRCFELRLSVNHSLALLILVGLCGGLAISTKYNALPIALLPLWLCLIARNPFPAHWAAALLMPPLAFLAGSPYILAEIPLFLDHLGYEIWHYGIAGHVGHTAEPGWGQILHYGSWLCSSGVGYAGCLAALLGIIVVVAAERRKALIVLFFPVLYFALMAAQKANFTRNFLVMVPFVALLAAAPIALTDLMRNLSRRGALLAALIILVAICFGPLKQAIEEREGLSKHKDSRNDAYQWLLENEREFSDVAVDGRLQLPPFTAWQNGKAELNRRGISRIANPLRDPVELYLAGYDWLVSGSPAENERLIEEFAEPETVFAGAPHLDRIVDNPAIHVYRLEDNPSLKAQAYQRAMQEQDRVLLFAPVTENESPEQALWSCPVGAADSAPEDYCWINSKFARLRLADLAKHSPRPSPLGLIEAEFDIMTPWPNQRIALLLSNWSKMIVLKKNAGKWKKVAVQVPYEELIKNTDIAIEIERIHSPATQGGSGDGRRLGVAVRSVRLRR